MSSVYKCVGVVCLLFASFISQTHGQGNAVQPIPGDLNLDGNIDFADFLLFVDNFGRTGPVPTPPQPVVHIVEVAVRDTVYLPAGSETPQEERAGNLLGFWKFLARYPKTEYTFDYYYILGHISDQPFADGELPVWGAKKWGIKVLGGYNAGLQQYTVLESNSAYNGLFVFDIQNDKAVGSMYFYDKGETINDGSVLTLTPDSGRTVGDGFDTYAPKLAIPPDLAEGRKVGAIPQEIIDAHDRLKARLGGSLE